MDKVLKQRLVGASILIALAVIFLPMLFDNGERDSVEERELALDVPDRDSGDRRVRRLALDPDQARRPPADSQAEPSPSEPEAEVPRPVKEESGPVRDQDNQGTTGNEQTSESGLSDLSGSEETESQTESDQQSTERADEAQSEPETETEPETEPEAETESAGTADESDSVPSAAVDGGWAVQVAVFSSRETANSIRQRLEDLGHEASMEVLVRDQTELFRLQTGPYSDETTAERARAQIASTVAGVEPATRELSGGGGADNREGLAVQVGSFASNGNAERLVEQLTEAGFDAFMFSEETGGRTIWRVRVGAYEERADAERLLETLRDEQGLEGIVVSHP
ncbi:SPOR domain-containing protein [Wenzhouxiangella sp. EGI_FJ10305]|uniref:SPOR domain-containing protein n=1 Tax=Wenzhouxiangella sp. EGI_FJ10305 TaxID=3243768 RepID=UPI0035DE2929